MPRAKKEVIKLRRKEIANLYMKGMFQADIAAKYNITQQQVSLDLKAVYKLWKQSAVMDFNTMKERELIKIDNLEKTYWESWEESKIVAQIDINPDGYESIKKTPGNPSYLTGVQWCISKRCDILGLDAPQRAVIENYEGVPPINWVE